jgi:hypothetical protein
VFFVAALAALRLCVSKGFIFLRTRQRFSYDVEIFHIVGFREEPTASLDHSIHQIGKLLAEAKGVIVVKLVSRR